MNFLCRTKILGRQNWTKPLKQKYSASNESHHLVMSLITVSKPTPGIRTVNPKRMSSSPGPPHYFMQEKLFQLSQKDLFPSY